MRRLVILLALAVAFTGMSSNRPAKATSSRDTAWIVAGVIVIGAAIWYYQDQQKKKEATKITWKAPNDKSVTLALGYVGNTGLDGKPLASVSPSTNRVTMGFTSARNNNGMVPAVGFSHRM